MPAIEVAEWGRGPAVVLFNGFPLGTDALEPLVAALQPNHRVLLPHFPGYAGSARLEPYSWSGAIDAVAAALVDRKVEAAALVGFSGGAWRACQLALGGRLRVSCIAALGGLAHFADGERDAFRGFAGAFRAGAELAAVAAQRWFSPAVAARADSLELARRWLGVGPAAVAADEYDALAAEPELLPRLAQLACPLLARTGADDQAAPPAKAEAMARRAPRGELELVSGRPHMLLVEDAEATTASVVAFIDRHHPK